MISLALIIWGIFYFDWRHIFHILEGVKPSYLVLLFFIYIFDYLVRAFRWRLLLYPICQPLSFLKVFHAYNFSQFANVFLPARGGELFRVLIINREFNISKRTLLGTLLFERILDVFAMGGVLIGVLYVSQKSLSADANLLKNLFFWGGLFIAVPFLMMVFLLLYRRIPFHYKTGGKLKKWIDRIEPVFQGFSSTYRPPLLLGLIGLSFFMWALNAFILYLYMQSLSFHTPFWAAVVVLLFQLLGELIPSAPSSVGTFHASTILGCKIIHLAADRGLVLGFLNHFYDIIIKSIFGCLSIPFINLDFKSQPLNIQLKNV